MKNIIVFGATGNIGRYMTEYLRNEFNEGEYDIVPVGRSNVPFFEKIGVNQIQVDIRSEDDFDRLPTKNVYAVVNLAGVLPAYLEEFDPFVYIDTNISGGIRILEYARKCGVNRILYAQTWAEQAGFFGKEEVLSSKLGRQFIFHGDHAFYAITKSMVVDTMKYYQEEYGIHPFVFRLPNVYLYSPQKEYYVNGKRRIVPYRYMIEQAERGEDIELWGNPDAYKDILYVKDLCQMMYRALLAPSKGGIYNAGTGIKTTLKEQIEGIIDVFNPADSRSKIIMRPEKESFVSFVMDIDDLQKELGYKPEYTYKKYLEDYKKEKERSDWRWK